VPSELALSESCLLTTKLPLPARAPAPQRLQIRLLHELAEFLERAHAAQVCAWFERSVRHRGRQETLKRGFRCRGDQVRA
jgi:hypothetical protein